MVKEKKWFAVYTAPKAEKKVSLRLEQQGIDHYLPTQKLLKQWSDRKKWVEEPLFRSYLFVHIEEALHFTVLNTHGVVKFISFGGITESIPDYQIETIRRLLMESTEMEITHENFQPGTPVEITAGPLMGTLGELISFRGENRIAVKIHTLDTSVLINIQEKYTTVISDERKLAMLDSIRKPKFVAPTRELG